MLTVKLPMMALACLLLTPAFAASDWISISTEAARASSEKRYQEAIDLYRKAFATSPEEPDEKDLIAIGIIHSNLSIPLAALERHEEAEAELLKALNILAKIPAAKTQHLTTLQNYATFHMNHLRFDKAEAVYLKTLDEIGPVTAGNLTTWLQIQTYLAHLYQWTAAFEKTEVLLMNGLKTLAAQRLPGAGNLHYPLATNYNAWGRYRDAVPILELLCRQADADPRTHPQSAATYESTLGESYAALGLYDRAEAILKKAAARYPTPRDRAYPLCILGNVYRGQGRFREAEETLKECIRLRGEKDTSNAVIYQGLGTLYQVQGRFEEAEPCFRRSAEGYDATLGEHPETAKTYSRYGQMRFAQGDLKEAERLLRKAMAMFEKKAPQHPEAAGILHHLGILHAAQGRLADADAEFRKALALRQKSLGRGHPDVGATASQLGRLCQQQLKLDEAEPFLKLALEVDEAVLGPEHPGTAASLTVLAELRLTQARPEDAETLMLRALAIQEKALGPDHPATGEALEALTRIYRMQGRPEEGSKLALRIRAIRDKVSAELVAPEEPGPSPTSVPPPPAALARPASTDYREALRRGLVQVEEARRAAPADADTKRRAYTGAETALKEALAALEHAKASGKTPDPSMDLETEMTRVRGLLYECRKNKPLSLK